jgi:hypothetical protein
MKPVAVKEIKVTPPTSNQHGRLSTGFIILTGQARPISQDKDGEWNINDSNTNNFRAYMDVEDNTETLIELLLFNEGGRLSSTEVFLMLIPVEERQL